MRFPLPALVCSLVATGVLCSPPSRAAQGPPQPRRMFATSVTGTGDLESWPQAGGAGGVAAGDAICQALAAGAGLPNSTAYAAWLSDGTTDAYCHLLGVTGTRAGGCAAGLEPAGPWLRTDGRIFSGDLDELTAIGPHRPPLYDEAGNVIGGLVGLTGTRADGTLASGETCAEWTGSATGRVGRLSRTVRQWTDHSERMCISPFNHLLCFETGAGAPLPEPEEPGGLVFVSSVNGTGDLGSWPAAGGATGVAAGDAICRRLAGDAALPDPDGFVAWLSIDGSDAIDRLGAFPGPWKRVDGVQAIRLGGPDGPELDTSLSITERGQTVEFTAFTGTFGDGAWAGLDCSAWTAGTNSVQGWHGWVNDAQFRWTNDSGTCEVPRRLYCFGATTVLFIDGFEIGSAGRWSAAAP